MEDAEKFVTGAFTASSCPCPCNCNLPPPCNQPPKCLQSMTGYYHYPYGFWFCGPYHVNTGPVPVDGPIKPGGPCGPVAGCPNFGSCGPPCKPCGPCPCPCGPCPCGPCPRPCGPCPSPCIPCTCGLCALCNPQNAYSNGYGPFTSTHGPLCSYCGYPSIHSSYCHQTSQCYCQDHTCTSQDLEPQENMDIQDVLKNELNMASPATPTNVQSQWDSIMKSGTITIDPKYAKTFPFNKPTFRRTESN